MSGYKLLQYWAGLTTMYLTHEYLVNSSRIGKVKNKLKSERIINGFFNRKTVGTLLLSMVNHPYRN